MLFFFKIITTQTEISENEITARIVKDMEDILVGKTISTDSASEVKISEKDFEFKCEEPCNELTGCNSWLGIKKAENRIELNTQPVFTIENLRSSKIYAFAQGWDVPFHTANFLYIAAPGEKIVFPTNCNTKPLCNKIFTLIPQKLKDARIVIKGEDDKLSRFKKYIEFEVPSGNPTRKKEVVIDEANHQIHFYENGRLQASEYYFLEEAIIGAAFTQDHKTYSCNMKKAFYKLRNLAIVLEGKRSYLEINAPADPAFCRSHFLTTQNQIASFNTLYKDLDTAKLVELNTRKQELEHENNELRRGSCASVY